ncbi:MAG TPA: lipid-A-disaccharide synthase [Terriglobales bacterium]|jgi:lipid-A-disaccharide synthase|nr:lipid-A-disaccharide synthase [Terriglobales bacterium]
MSFVQVLISAGEASGEMYGAQLIEALRRVAELRSAGQVRAPAPTRDWRLQFFGAGGERMAAAGCEIVVDAKELAVVGITEILSRLPRILELFRKLIRAADEKQPTIAIVIDSPAFNWRVARQMRRRGVPVVYYVCPQFWAWRQGRVKLLRKYVDKALVIFPFEEKFYRDRGVDATFVGHPLADLAAPQISREEFATQYGLDSAKHWIAILPGSRRKEFRLNLPTIIDAARLLGKDFQFLLPVASTLDVKWVHDQLFFYSHVAKKKIGPFVALTNDARASLYHSRAGIVASGTATVEAALMGTPFVMVYRVSPLTYALGKPRVKVPYFAMVNLIAEEEVVPELVQQKFTAENIVAEMNKIIPDGESRGRMIEWLAMVRARLSQGSGGADPSERAAKIILGMI